MASNNFEVFNEDYQNLTSDVNYVASVTRQGGLVDGIADTLLHNKLYRQTSVMVAALAAAMEAKGYDMLDSSLANLILSLSNLATLNEISQPGDIKAVAHETVQSGWLECNGASLLRSDYAALFTAIGTIWGTADVNHFNIPDFRGKFLRGWDHGSGNDPDASTRTAQATGGSTGNHVGSIQIDEFKSHRHQLSNSSGGAGTHQLPHDLVNEDYNPIEMTDFTGGSETRPVNANVMYLIKY